MNAPMLINANAMNTSGRVGNEINAKLIGFGCPVHSTVSVGCNNAGGIRLSLLGFTVSNVIAHIDNLAIIGKLSILLNDNVIDDGLSAEGGDLSAALAMGEIIGRLEGRWRWTQPLFLFWLARAFF